MELGASLLEFASENSAGLGELQPRSKANAQKTPNGQNGAISTCCSMSKAAWKSAPRHQNVRVMCGKELELVKCRGVVCSRKYAKTATHVI
jgi:hypothetical protein